jgi:hypothetical protein
MAKHRMDDVIVLLPGILGSVLARDGKEVWAPTPGAGWRALWSLGRSVKDLQLTEDPADKDDLGDGVVATRLVPGLHLIPGLWGIDGYSGIRRMILDNFDVVAGRTYLEFPYDWRRDNRVAARKLAQTVGPVLHEVRKDNPQAKLVLVGHSMGGLVSRYYLECLDGWKDTRMLVTFGTPYRGSLNALDFIANGFVKKVGPLKLLDLSPLLRSLTSVYQLLPIYQCIDAGGPKPVRPAESQGVPHLDGQRASSALRDFFRAIEAGVSDRPEDAYEIQPVVGITQPTKQSAVLADGKLRLVETRRDAQGADVDESGDGTVPRVSATPIELGDNSRSIYAAQKHATLQEVESVQTNLLGILTQVPELSSIRDLRSGLSLYLDDAFGPGEPVAVRVEVAEPRLELATTVTDLATKRQEGPFPLRDDADGSYRLELPPRPPGDYRVTVAGMNVTRELVQPVSDIFMVAPDEPDEPDERLILES